MSKQAEARADVRTPQGQHGNFKRIAPDVRLGRGDAVRVRLSLKGSDQFTRQRIRAQRGLLAARIRQFGRSKRRRYGWQ